MESNEPKNSDQNSSPLPPSGASNAMGLGSNGYSKESDKSPSLPKVIKKEGRVIEALPNAFFKVVLDDGKEVRGFLSGKMKLNRIKILPGDKVTIEMTPYDLNKGRIVYRLK